MTTTASTVAWMSQAACRGTMLPGFFPPTELECDEDPAARQLCASCPVRAACLAWIRQVEEPGYEHDYWGGTTAHVRSCLRRPLRRASCPACGASTLATFDRHQACIGCGLSWLTARYRRANGEAA